MRGRASWRPPPAIACPAPPKFVQWPQSLSRPPGSSAIFTCMAQGVPEPWLAWLKNGKGLSPGDNIWLTHNNRYLRYPRPAPSTLPDCRCILTCPRRPAPPPHNTLYHPLKPPASTPTHGRLCPVCSIQAMSTQGGVSFCFWAGLWVSPPNQGRGLGGKEPPVATSVFPLAH